jgi:hypothetical protein
LNIFIVNQLPEEEWRHFVDRHPHSNIFHTPEMLQVFQRTKGYRPKLWASVDEHKKILALFLPIQIVLGGGLPHFLTARAVSYGSVLYEQSHLGKEALAVLLNTYTRNTDHKVLFTELRNQSDLSEVQVALTHWGFLYEDHLNYRISLDRPRADLLQGFGRRTRKHIRRGLRKGQVVIEDLPLV